MRYDAGFVAFVKQKFYGGAAALAVIERQVVDVHPYKFIRRPFVHPASKLQSVSKGFLSVIERIFDGGFQQLADALYQVGCEISSNRVSAERKRKSGLSAPALPEIRYLMKPRFGVGQ